MNELAPFQSPESEQAILGAILVEGGDIIDELSDIVADHFYIRSHQIIFTIAFKIHRDHKPIDSLVVINQLKMEGRLDEVGGDLYISKLVLTSITTAHVRFYADIVIEKWKARRLAEIAARIPLSLQKEESKNVLAEAERSIFALSQTSRQDENLLAIGIQEVLENINRRENPESMEGLLSTGLKIWQDAFGGILPGRFYIVGGLPGSGKSALAEQITLHCLLNGKRILFLSKEMRRDRLLERMICKHAGVNYSKFLRNHSISQERDRMRQSAEYLKNADLYLLNPVQIDGFGFRSVVRRETRKKPIDLIVVDYIQKLNLPKGLDRLEGTIENSVQLSETVLETDIPILGLVQLNRGYKGQGRPSMRDIKETSQIEQDADGILLIWEDEQGRVFSFDKNRDGAEHDEHVGWNGELMTFSSVPKPETDRTKCNVLMSD